VKDYKVLPRVESYTLFGADYICRFYSKGFASAFPKTAQYIMEFGLSAL